jgi:hypothetical protein
MVGEWALNKDCSGQDSERVTCNNRSATRSKPSRRHNYRVKETIAEDVEKKDGQLPPDRLGSHASGLPLPDAVAFPGLRQAPPVGQSGKARTWLSGKSN